MYRINYIFSIVALIIFKVVTCKMVKLKVHNELPNPGYPNMAHLTEAKFYLRMKPTNFSGPDHLKSLVGKCFKLRDTKYEYQLCPFDNITQEDIQSTYSPYKGALGVWGQWQIQNNTFTAMEMVEGNPCGKERFRSTEVFLKCSNITALRNVTEPSKCHYRAILSTPLVCGKNSMVVYPRLTEPLQLKWDEALSDLKDQELTEKGYDKMIKNVFTDAGYLLSEDKRLQLIEESSKSQPKMSCEEEMESLKKRVQDLENELDLKENRIMELLSNNKHANYYDYYGH